MRANDGVSHRAIVRSTVGGNGHCMELEGRGEGRGGGRGASIRISAYSSALAREGRGDKEYLLLLLSTETSPVTQQIIAEMKRGDTMCVILEVGTSFFSSPLLSFPSTSYPILSYPFPASHLSHLIYSPFSLLSSLFSCLT